MVVRVNLGSGPDYKEDFINIDIDKKAKTDICTDFVKGIPLKSGSVDEIYCKNVFEHIPNPLDFLLEIKRVLKKGARARIITDNSSYFIFHLPRWKGLHDTYNQTHPDEDQHYFFFQKGHLESFTKKAGFKLLKLDYKIMPGSKNNVFFQKFMGFLIGKKFAYANFEWIIVK